MARRRRTRLEAEAERRLRTRLIPEGEKVRRARRRRRWTQRELGRRCELAQSTISQVERGLGGSLSLNAWQRMAIALDLPLDLALGRDAQEEPPDVGHLSIQELILRLARAIGLAEGSSCRPDRPTLGARPMRASSITLGAPCCSSNA